MDYKEEKNDLRVRLANSYMESEDFSMEDNPTHFDELYMSPRIVEHHILNRGNTNVHENIDEEINSVKSYKAIFYKGDSLASTVYLVGSSGTGKTIFSRKCVLEWSYHHLKIHDDVQSTPKMNDLFTDRDCFGGIDFLFHIRLRDGNNVCSLTDMIKDQLISRIYDKEDIEKEYKLILKVLDENACLIVAENLHEWAHPPEASCACTHLEKADTPSFTYAKKACIMLTTRHWRFHSIRSVELRANTYFEIEGILDRKGFVMKAILAKNGHETYVDTFFTHFADRKFAKMLSVPIFSMQLVDLYLELDTPKTALCDICSSIVKMRLKKIPTYHQKAPQTDPVHKRRRLSVKHDEVVEALSELAIRTIVSRESSLNREFSQDLVDEMLTVSEKTIALKSGILQQQHLNAKQSVMKVSFCHKSIQDFLAATFLVNHDDAFETLIKSCKEQNNYLTCIRIKQVLIFTFGLKPRLGEEMSEWIDDVFSQHNNYLLPNERFKFKDKALSLQRLMIDAYREAQAKKHIGIKVTISNFIILDDEQNKDDLVDLIRMNKTRVKSIFINKSNAIFNNTDLQGIFNDSSQTLIAVELDERDGFFDLTKCNNIRYMWLQGTDCTSVLLDPTHIVALELRNTSHAIEQQILDGISTNSPNLLHLSLSKMKEAQLLHQTIPELTCLQTVYIGDTDFGERCIYFPPSVNGVTLCNVTMSANSMIGMLKKIGTSNMSAHIFLHNCIVTDKSRLQNIRASLETSEGLSVKSFQEKVNHLYAHITTLHVQSVDEEPETSIIPDRAKLNVICAEKGRRSDEVLAFTDTICDTIREKLDSHFTARNLKTKVVDIYASYPKEDERSIIFVITNTHKVQAEVVMQVVDYGFVLKSLDSATTESKLNEAEFEDFLPQADICKLNQYISINSKQLFQCHSNLRIVTGSRVDVSRFSERKRVCIQLFVHAKGFIPLREEPFPKQYEGFTVIVSEGICVLYTNLAATERHDELKIGCQIMRAELFDANHLPLNGTLGGFFEHPEYGLCGLSCAHVLLSKTELTRCKENNGKVHYPDVNASVYQPSYAESNKIGHLVQAIYDEGNEQEAGVELAVFNISDREPLSGAFPAIKLDDHAVSHFKSYNSGTTLGKALLTGKQVWKFGMATQLTEGCVGTIVCSIKVPPLKYDLLGHSLELYNQLQVYSRNKSETFADKGDSGALVFYDRPNGESVCVGMVVGGWIGEENVAAVMPIDTIIRQLGVQQLKPFLKALLVKILLTCDLNLTKLMKMSSVCAGKRDKV